MSFVLTPMAPGRDAEFAEMLDEFRGAGELDVYRGIHAAAWQGYAVFYDLVSRMRAGGYPRPEIVPMDSYFIEEDGRIVGECYVRHRLNARLEQIGGHIGYKVRPSARGRGAATAALKLALARLHELGVDQALVTCDPANQTSARVIEKCGGIQTTDTMTELGPERRYRVKTKADS